MKNGPFIDDLPIKMVIFHSYVKLPEGRRHVPIFRMKRGVFSMASTVFSMVFPWFFHVFHHLHHDLSSMLQLGGHITATQGLS